MAGVYASTLLKYMHILYVCLHSFITLYVYETEQITRVLIGKYTYNININTAL